MRNSGSRPGSSGGAGGARGPDRCGASRIRHSFLSEVLLLCPSVSPRHRRRSPRRVTSLRGCERADVWADGAEKRAENRAPGPLHYRTVNGFGCASADLASTPSVKCACQTTVIQMRWICLSRLTRLGGVTPAGYRSAQGGPAHPDPLSQRNKRRLQNKHAGWACPYVLHVASFAKNNKKKKNRVYYQFN